MKHKNCFLWLTVIFLIVSCGPGISDYSEHLWGNYEYRSDSTTKTSIVDVSSGNTIVGYCIEKYWTSNTDKAIVAIRFPIEISHDSEGHGRYSGTRKNREIWIIFENVINKYSEEVGFQKIENLLFSHKVSEEFIKNLSLEMIPYLPLFPNRADMKKCRP